MSFPKHFPVAIVRCVVASAVILFGMYGGMAEEARQTEVIIAEGVGTDVEGARKDACRNAVRQAVGAYVDSETVVANDELITDRIVMLSPAFVEKAEPIAGSEKKEDGLVRVRVRTHVRITKLLDELAAGRIKTRPVTKKLDTQSLLAELTTKSDQHEAQRDILAKLMRDYPESCLTVSQAGKESIEKKADGSVAVNVPLAIRPNDENYAAFSKSLCEVLSATKRASGEFKVDGTKFGPNPEYAKNSIIKGLRDAFTNDDYMLGMFPREVQQDIRKSCDSAGRSPIVGIGPAYSLWNGGPNEGIWAQYYESWRDVRQNKSDDWIVICVTSAKKDYRQTNWKWFHVTAEEYKQWFATTPASFVCSTQLIDKDSEEVAGDAIDIGKFGADRKYHKLLWCVPMYVNIHNSYWYTPELRMVRSIKIDAEDAANIASLRITLERGPATAR
jgi:hypothetical protein